MDTVERAIAALGRGEMIIVTDDEGRENEGDLVMDAAFANPEAVNFMIRFGRGLVCVPMEETRLAELGCLRYQGFLFGRPQRIEAFEQAFASCPVG